MALLILICGRAESNLIHRDSSTTEYETSRAVLFIGTSLTAGFGLPREQAFPYLLEKKMQSAGLDFHAVNAGVSGETSAAALRRINWLLRQEFDVVVIELGANDMLRGIDTSLIEDNIQAIVNRIRETRPNAAIVLAGMLATPNLGEAYRRSFAKLYSELAERNNLPLVHFLLRDVGGRPAINLEDGIHPNAVGHAVIARNVWHVLKPVLVELQQAREVRD